MIANFTDRMKTLSGISPSGFKHVYLETMGFCTNSCFMCPRQSTPSKKGRMSNALFECAIEKLKACNFSGELHLYGQGEPFLDKKILERILYAKKELPKAKIVMISNFTTLNDRIIERIVNSPIDSLSCTCYAFQPELYKTICGKDNFKSFFINLAKFLKLFAETIPFSFACYANYLPSYEDADFLNNFLFNYVPASYIQTGHTVALFNSTHSALEPSRWYYSPCVYTDLKIDSNGVLASCPCDAGNLLKIGDLSQSESLAEIYNSERAKKLRKRMLYSTKQDAYCQKCAFRRSQSLVSYLLGRNSPSDTFKNKIKTKKNSHAEIKDKLRIFNSLFPSGREEEWLTTLSTIRSDFYNK